MYTNDEKLLYKDQVFQIVGCAIEVLNTLGHGLIEKPYENSLAVEFGLRNIPFRQQPPFDVLYKENKVGLFVPDLIAFDAVVVDTKVIDRIADHEVPCGSDSQFQTSQTRVGTIHLMNWCSLVSIRGCIDAGRN